MSWLANLASPAVAMEARNWPRTVYVGATDNLAARLVGVRAVVRDAKHHQTKALQNRHA